MPLEARHGLTLAYSRLRRARQLEARLRRARDEPAENRPPSKPWTGLNRPTPDAKAAPQTGPSPDTVAPQRPNAAVGREPQTVPFTHQDRFRRPRGTAGGERKPVKIPAAPSLKPQPFRAGQARVRHSSQTAWDGLLPKPSRRQQGSPLLGGPPLGIRAEGHPKTGCEDVRDPTTAGVGGAYAGSADTAASAAGRPGALGAFPGSYPPSQKPAPGVLLASDAPDPMMGKNYLLTDSRIKC
jgi:hypothetical protein